VKPAKRITDRDVPNSRAWHIRSFHRGLRTPAAVWTHTRRAEWSGKPGKPELLLPARQKQFGNQQKANQFFRHNVT
jgi:hypothetical protein